MFQLGECMRVCEFAAKSLCYGLSPNQVDGKCGKHTLATSFSRYCLSVRYASRYGKRARDLYICTRCDCPCLCTRSSTSIQHMNIQSTTTHNALHTYLYCGAYSSIVYCPFVVRSDGCACVGSRVHVGGAVYVHPIRILFYDRRVIMCAVMLNSTYLLWNALSLALFESLIILLRHFWRWQSGVMCFQRLLSLSIFILIYIFGCCSSHSFALLLTLIMDSVEKLFSCANKAATEAF